MSLIVYDTLSLKTQIGVCKIQLCIGDITKLPKDEEVDVLVVSAFPGDYSPTPSSLIGALAINLGISVRKLSKEKEEDLRRQYYCWWSKPLPEHLSFRRILCFEGGFGSRGQTPPQVVGAVFRCLVPILSGNDIKEGSVIMPLLASGDQGYSKTLMLNLLMDSAIQWIKAGLQLRVLKIVLFSRHPEKPDKSFAPLFNLFQEMNSKYGEQDLSYKTQLIYDVYMSHSPKDRDSALQVVNFLKTERNVSVFHDFQELNDTKSWQEEIFDIMRRCARVVALLSPGYLETESCIEQYNMALCLNRRSHGTLLAPFYIASLDYMPTYMSLIQYEDCRPNNSEKLRSASIGVVKGLNSLQEDASGVSSDMSRNTAQSYDVFISYSHCNKTSALNIVEVFQSLDADLNLFIDTEGLNTGTSWQQTLYSALDSSKSTIALLSPDYIKSKVCYEEFCLSQALSVDSGSALELVSLLVEPVEELPQWCVKPVPVDCTQTHGNQEKVMVAVCTDLVNKLRGSFTSPEDELTRRMKDLRSQHLTVESASDNYRKTCFVLRSNVLSSAVNISTFTHASRAGHASEAFHVGRSSPPEASQETSSDLTSPTTTSSKLTSLDVTSNAATASPVTSSSAAQVASQRLAVCDVAVSFAEQDRKSAVLLKQLLLEKMPSLKVSEPMSGDVSRVQCLDVARVMVPLLSPAFLTSSELIEELNIAICRNRSSSRRVLFPVHVAPLPPKPSYVHLIPCEASRSNYKWASKVVEQDVKDDVSRMAQHHHLDVDLVFCLKTAADQISQRLAEETRETDNANRVFLSLHVVDENWKEVKRALREQQGLEKWKSEFGIKIGGGSSDLKVTTSTKLLEKQPVITNESGKVENNVRFENEPLGETGNKEMNGVELILRVNNSDQENSGCCSLEQEKLATQQPLYSSAQQESNGHETQGHFPVASSGELHCAEEELRNATQREAETSKTDSKSCAVV